MSNFFQDEDGARRLKSIETDTVSVRLSVNRRGYVGRLKLVDGYVYHGAVHVGDGQVWAEGTGELLHDRTIKNSAGLVIHRGETMVFRGTFSNGAPVKPDGCPVLKIACDSPFHRRHLLMEAE